MCFNRWELFIFAVLIFNIEAQAFFKMTNIACTDMNNSIAKAEICRLKAVGRDVVEATVKFRLLQRLNQIHLHVNLLRKYNTYKPFILNGTADACAFFRNPQKSPLRILYKLIEKYSNTNHSCPYENEIFINRFRPEHDNLILPLPTGDYLILFGLYVPKSLLGYLKVWFSYRENDILKTTNVSKKGK